LKEKSVVMYENANAQGFNDSYQVKCAAVGQKNNLSFVANKEIKLFFDSTNFVESILLPITSARSLSRKF
jgi:hypothetical protein